MRESFNADFSGCPKILLLKFGVFFQKWVWNGPNRLIWEKNHLPQVLTTIVCQKNHFRVLIQIVSKIFCPLKAMMTCGKTHPCSEKQIWTYLRRKKYSGFSARFTRKKREKVYMAEKGFFFLLLFSFCGSFFTHPLRMPSKFWHCLQLCAKNSPIPLHWVLFDIENLATLTVCRNAFDQLYGRKSHRGKMLGEDLGHGKRPE